MTKDKIPEFPPEELNVAVKIKQGRNKAITGKTR
jgi:hypothetical protein